MRTMISALSASVFRLFGNTDALAASTSASWSAANCARGTIELSFNTKANEYRDKYDLTMKVKAVHRGEFCARLCKPLAPAKK